MSHKKRQLVKGVDVNRLTLLGQTVLVKGWLVEVAMVDEAKDKASTPTVAVAAMEMDRSIAGLVERFGISKQTLYDKYFAELSIVPKRQGQRSYIALEELEKLAFVVAKMRSGEATSVADAVQGLRAKGVYVPPRPEKAAKTRKLDAASDASHVSAQPSGADDEDDEGAEAIVAFEPGGLVPWLRATPASIVQLLERLTTALSLIAAKAEGLSAPTSALPSLDEYELLEKAYAKRWVLSTSKLAAILNLSPGTLSSKAVFDWGGFRLTKNGKIGRESAWTITKPED